MMGLLIEEKSLKKMAVVIPRWMKTLLFLINMLISLLVFSGAPIFVVVVDALLPSACFSAALRPSLQTFSSHLTNYDFRRSLIDIPLLSITRSFIIFCVYGLSRGAYLATATVCAAASLVLVSLKGSYILMMSDGAGAMEVALLISSAGLAVGHVVVAYRISCRERRKLLLYTIDIEAISACKKGFPRYHHKILQELRAK